NPRKPAAAAPAAGAGPGPAAPAAAAPAEASLGVSSAYDAIYKQGRAGAGKSILTAIETEMIKRAMEETRGNQLRSAMILGINRSTLKKRLLEMREAGIKVFT
ncbi:MAG: helix-turn-helix domain-containing protein, partial [Opitutales bacterium]